MTANLLFKSIVPIIINDVLSERVEYVVGDVQVTTKGGTVYDITPTFIGNAMTIDTGQNLTEVGDFLEVTFNVRTKNTAGGETVYNQAVITAANLTESQKTNTTRVTIFENPEKEISNESETGQDGSAVKVGDKITYNISYGNSDTTAAAITIIDGLADGVDFESTSDGGIYDRTTHTVTWSIPDVDSGTGRRRRPANHQHGGNPGDPRKSDKDGVGN